MPPSDAIPRLLVVEDEAIIAMSLSDELEAFGFDVDTALPDGRGDVLMALRAAGVSMPEGAP